MIKKSKKIMVSVLMALSLLAIFPAINVFALDGPKLKENTVNRYFKYYTDYTLLKEDDPIRKSIENDSILREYRDKAFYHNKEIQERSSIINRDIE